MKINHLLFSLLALWIASIPSFGQAAIVINDPSVESVKSELSAAEKTVMDKNVLPITRKQLASDVCEESVEISGVARGAFTKAGANQTLVFYQFCQTGNGLGSVGVAVIDNGKVAANYVSRESGWSIDVKRLPDINQNGLDEIALYYSGGMHQGAGGSGVDIMEFSANALNGIGWFKADEFTDAAPATGFKVTVKPGKAPAYFQEKYVSSTSGKWRKVGRVSPLKLTKVFGKFEAAK